MCPNHHHGGKMKYFVTIAALLVSSVTIASSSERGPDFNLEGGGRALIYAEDAADKLNDVKSSADNAADYYARNGNYQRAQEFEDVSDRTKSLQQDLYYEVVRPLRDGESDSQVARSFRQLQSEISNLRRAEDALTSEPNDIRNLLADTYYLLNQLGDELDRGCVPQQWVGTCEVVLETLWGDNVDKFYGVGEGRTQQEALVAAQRDGQNQCQAHRSNLTKCTLNNANCSAHRPRQ